VPWRPPERFPYFERVVFVVRRLILELDGSQHTMQEADSQEALQTAYLTEQGYQVKRFWNE
jgi:very-short-patch-repair endonuclease